MCDAGGVPPLDPALSGAFLHEAPAGIGRPMLVIGYYNRSQGLLAGYQSASGKRILLRSWWRTNGSIAGEVVHLDPESGLIKPLLGLSRRSDSATGKRIMTFDVAGVDVVEYLAKGLLMRRAPSVEADAVQQFFVGDAGRAYSEAIPALYAMLEPLETDPKLAELQAPLGAILTALQLSTGINSGFEQADAVLGSTRSGDLRGACGTRHCLFRGLHFTVHANGLFDVLTKTKKAPGKGTASCAAKSAGHIPSWSGRVVPMNGDGTCTDPGGCFGMCGLGCFNPGEVFTPECLGHDLCVCKWSDVSCAFGIPDDCDGCSSLVDAIISFLAELFRRLIEPEDMDSYVWW